MNRNTCAFTGHRPHKFPWGNDETDYRCVALKAVLAEQVRKLVAAGVTDFYTGMADGSDVWLSQIVLNLRNEKPTLKLHCFLPCEGQADKWSIVAQERYHSILEQADVVEYVSHKYYDGCMIDRNHRLVEASGRLLAVYNGERRGGTAATVRYAQKLDREIFMVDPVSLAISQSCGNIEVSGRNRFLEMKERGETILFSELLAEIPPDEVLIHLFPSTRNPECPSVRSSELEVLKLRLKGFKHQEIAEQLGLSSSQVASRSRDVKNALYMNIPSYICVDIPALGKILNIPGELTGYKLLSDLLKDMPPDEELMRLFIERGSIRRGKRGSAPTNHDLQLLKMRAQKQSYASISEAMGVEVTELHHQILLTLRRIIRGLQIQQDVLGLPMYTKPSVKKDQSPAHKEIDGKNMSVLSKRQREVWMLLEQGLKRKEIAQRLGITYGAVRAHIIHAERRFREYEQYCLEAEKNKESVFLPLTRGEVKVILAALTAYEKELERGVSYRVDSDLVGQLPFEAKIVADLFDKAQEVIYGKLLTRMPKNWAEDT